VWRADDVRAAAMSQGRKLKTEIDRTLRKVSDGVEIFDAIWDKVYSAEDQSQKERYAVDLKKELKKLQRCRDQIKTWMSSPVIKDKVGLMETRKLIETKMEAFKECEKEVKTKAFSKEGLAQAEELDPEEVAKIACMKWVQQFKDALEKEVEGFGFEVEKIKARRRMRESDREKLRQFAEVSVLLCTVTFHANLAHSLTRSP